MICRLSTCTAGVQRGVNTPRMACKGCKGCYATYLRMPMSSVTLLAARPPPLLPRSLLANGALSTAADEVAAWLGMLKAMTWGSSGPTNASSFPANAARLLLPRSLASHTSCHAANRTSGLHWLQPHTYQKTISHIFGAVNQSDGIARFK